MPIDPLYYIGLAICLLGLNSISQQQQRLYTGLLLVASVAVIVGLQLVSALGSLIITGLLLTTYVLGQYLQKNTTDNKQTAYAIGIIVNLVVFIFFAKLPINTLSIQGVKYAITLVGVSYIILKNIHILTDAKQSKLKEFGLLSYLCYSLFFPTLLSGPILRYPQFTKSIKKRSPINSDTLLASSQRIIVGLFKKYAIAATLMPIALSSSVDSQTLTTAGAWVYSYMFYIVLYCDFSGYSDIAIGSGRLCGINIPENFDKPYLAGSVTEFWSRWHITLTKWLTDYIYFPTGKYLFGTRLKQTPLAIAVVASTATMVISGIWHGIALNYIGWGIYHGLGLAGHKVYLDVIVPKLSTTLATFRKSSVYNVVAITLTNHFVLFGWLLFVLSIHDMVEFVSVLAGF